MMSDIKGFKYLRAGSECAIERREPFGRGVSYSLATIKAFDPFAGIIEIVGSAYTFSTDGYQLGRTGGEPRRRLIVPVTPEIHRIVFRHDARNRLELLLHNWKTVDDQVIQALLTVLDEALSEKTK
jgi:hypothetical protein